MGNTGGRELRDWKRDSGPIQTEITRKVQGGRINKDGSIFGKWTQRVKTRRKP